MNYAELDTHADVHVSLCFDNCTNIFRNSTIGILLDEDEPTLQQPIFSSNDVFSLIRKSSLITIERTYLANSEELNSLTICSI